MEETEEAIEVYVALFSALQKRVGDAAAVVLQEIGKDRRCKMIQAERTTHEWHDATNIRRSQESEEAPATAKQLRWLRDLGAETPRGLTKSAASAMLDELLAARDA